MSRCEKCPLNASIKVNEKRIEGFAAGALEEEVASAIVNINETVREFYDGIAEDLDCDGAEIHPDTKQLACPFTSALENALRFGTAGGRLPHKDGYMIPKVIRDKMPKAPQVPPNLIVPPHHPGNGTGQYL